MAYYSGQVASYQELLEALVAACVAEGWIWTDQILSKGISFYKLWHHVTDGLSVRAGTGQDGTSLINPSPVTVRLGRYGYQNLQQSFPMFYSLHIFDNEVYLYTRFNVDYFYYAAFGFLNSSIWAAACCNSGVPSHAHSGANITPTSGNSSNNGRTQASGAFWNTSFNLPNSTISLGDTWINANSILAAAPFISRQPSNWNADSVFIPISIFSAVASSKVSFINELEHSRYVRIDNFEPEQVIVLGAEKWKVYPFYRKHSGERDGGYATQHSGTFGWAIRYDGP